MKDIYTDAENISKEFAECSKFLTAIGDETRQHMLLEMMKMRKCTGVRVGEITEKTNLSRPAVSHHLAIMKDAGIVKMRREGTMNFYYLDVEAKTIRKLINTLSHVEDVLATLKEMRKDIEEE